jgi:hypothetical protein
MIREGVEINPIPVVRRRHMCAAYTGEFIENSFVQIFQFCFLVIVPTCIGFDFHLLED